ncbi:hypothetical protein EYF80_058861 [Liparis tanakae]|uniref:Uncharacterized protein n=1 Tax=Liparis tanakae TaxID=230148 RepID=A0A4Z2EQ02_9TELE|nr:hypothetical protein EYF80_058861 [Liparis tanakae]
MTLESADVPVNVSQSDASRQVYLIRGGLRRPAGEGLAVSSADGPQGLRASGLGCSGPEFMATSTSASSAVIDVIHVNKGEDF